MRLDVYISSEMKLCSREKARYFIKNGDVTVNGMAPVLQFFPV